MRAELTPHRRAVRLVVANGIQQAMKGGGYGDVHFQMQNGRVVRVSREQAHALIAHLRRKATP